MKRVLSPNMSDYLTGHRKIKEKFFNQINELVDWRPISNIINKHYTKGDSVVGRPSYSRLLLFKMCLLQTWGMV